MARRGWVYALIAGGFSQAALPAAAPESAQEALLEVTVNGERQPMWTLIQLTREGDPWARRADLQSWGVQLAGDSPAAQAAPDTLLALNEVPGVHAAVDRASSTLAVEVQPALLNRHDYRTENPAPRAMPSPLGVFLNYDLGAAQSSGSNLVRAATELGVVNGDWVARSSWFGSAQDGKTANLRLDTNITADFPATRTSLQWGDTFARLGNTAEAVRIGGVSWGTDFSVTPTFITVPLPTISSVATTPGSVDVYVNGAKTQQLSIPGGPFSISGVPVTTGAGELTVVTHDLLGHTQTLTQSYYIPPQMLAPGLTVWDVQLGSKRQDYGMAGDLYSGWLAAAGQRYGITDRLTAQWRVEADETGAAASAQWLALIPGSALLSLSPSCSAVSGDAGCTVAAGYERDLNRLGYGLDLTYSTTGYTPVAAADRAPAVRWQVFSHAQATVAHGASFTLGGSWSQEAEGPHVFNMSLTAGKTLMGGGHLDLVLSRTGGISRSSFATLIYTRSIDGARTVSATAFAADGQTGYAATLQRNLPAGDGFGYLIRAGKDPDVGADASVQWNGDSAAVAALAQREGDRDSLSGEVSGSAVWLADDLFLARHMDRGFAVVHAQGLADVPVYLNDQPVTRTDAQGIAVLPALRPFEANKIDLDPTTLPLSMDVPQTRFQVIPYRRGGAYVEVPVQLGASVQLQREDGTPVPAGARIQAHCGAVPLGAAPLGAVPRIGVPVGSDGMAYVEGGAGDNILQVDWEGGRCSAHLRLPHSPSASPSDDAVRLVCATNH
jgi:outer membrane usher protein